MPAGFWLNSDSKLPTDCLLTSPMLNRGGRPALLADATDARRAPPRLPLACGVPAAPLRRRQAFWLPTLAGLPGWALPSEPPRELRRRLTMAAGSTAVWLPTLGPPRAYTPAAPGGREGQQEAGHSTPCCSHTLESSSDQPLARCVSSAPGPAAPGPAAPGP